MFRIWQEILTWDEVIIPSAIKKKFDRIFHEKSWNLIWDLFSKGFPSFPILAGFWPKTTVTTTKTTTTKLAATIIHLLCPTPEGISTNSGLWPLVGNSQPGSEHQSPEARNSISVFLPTSLRPEIAFEKTPIIAQSLNVCVVCYCAFLVCKLLRYESSTLILYKELSSSIFQSCQSVCQSGIGNTCPDLHFVQYIKA